MLAASLNQYNHNRMLNIKRLLFRQSDSEKKDMIRKITKQTEEIEKLKRDNRRLEMKAFMLSLDDESIHQLSREFKTLHQFGNSFVIEVDGFKGPCIYYKNEDLTFYDDKEIYGFLNLYRAALKLKNIGDAKADLLNKVGCVRDFSGTISTDDIYEQYDYKIHNGFTLYRIVYLINNDVLVSDCNRKFSFF